MATIAELIARAKAEAKAIGEAIGKAKARLAVFQGLLGRPVSTDAELDGLEVAEIERRYEELQREYDQKYKDKA